jgi:hypothetical protein
MDADDVELRNSATFGVANFASAVENHQQLVEEDCLPRLTRLVATDDPEAQLRAVAALRGLAVDAHLRPEIVNKGALPPLLRLANSEDVEVQQEVRRIYYFYSYFSMMFH